MPADATQPLADEPDAERPDPLSPARSGLVYARAGLILLAFACFVTEHLVHYPLALMAALGLVDALRQPRALAAPAARRLLILFGLIWLPMLCAWPTAVAQQRTAETIVLYLHFLPAAYFVLRACRDSEVLRLVGAGVAALVMFAAFDAFVQLIWRADLFGYPYEDGILKGVFYPKQRLGLFLAVFAPLVVDAVLRWCRHYPQLWLFLVPLLIAILMSLKRSAWVMLLLGMVAYLGLRWRHDRRLFNPRRFIQIGVVLLVAASAVGLSPPLKQRLADSSGLFSADPGSIDNASAHRLSLWRTGYRMFRAHPLTGVGPRGYRYVYADYAPVDDFWLARNGRGQTHPHLLLLEIAVETGLIGLLGFAVFYTWLLRLVLRQTVGNTAPVWLLGAAVAWFPGNAHLAFYGSYWSTLVWLLLAIGLASVRTQAAAH